jgi:hypothetical protein
MDVVFHARTIHIERRQIGRGQRPQRTCMAPAVRPLNSEPLRYGHRTNVRERGGYRVLGYGALRMSPMHWHRHGFNPQPRRLELLSDLPLRVEGQ